MTPFDATADEISEFLAANDCGVCGEVAFLPATLELAYNVADRILKAPGDPIEALTDEAVSLRQSGVAIETVCVIVVEICKVLKDVGRDVGGEPGGTAALH